MSCHRKMKEISCQVASDWEMKENPYFSSRKLLWVSLGGRQGWWFFCELPISCPHSLPIHLLVAEPMDSKTASQSRTYLIKCPWYGQGSWCSVWGSVPAMWKSPYLQIFKWSSSYIYILVNLCLRPVGVTLDLSLVPALLFCHKR